MEDTSHTSDPADLLVEHLKSEGHPDPSGWTKYLNKSDYNAFTDPSVRRSLVNEALRVELGKAENAGQYERYCLIDGADHDIWFRIIKETIAPKLVFIATKH